MKKNRGKISVIFEMLKISFNLDKKYFCILLLDSVINLFNMLIVIVLPSIIVLVIETGKNREQVLLLFICLVSLQFISELLHHNLLFSNEKVNSLFQKNI